MLPAYFENQTISTQLNNIHQDFISLSGLNCDQLAIASLELTLKLPNAQIENIDPEITSKFEWIQKVLNELPAEVTGSTYIFLKPTSLPQLYLAWGFSYLKSAMFQLGYDDDTKSYDLTIENFDVESVSYAIDFISEATKALTIAKHLLHEPNSMRLN
jgi:hypothetical protein